MHSQALERKLGAVSQMRSLCSHSFPDRPHLGLSCPALSWFLALSSFAWEALFLQVVCPSEGMAQPNFASQPQEGGRAAEGLAHPDQAQGSRGLSHTDCKRHREYT